MGINRFDSKNRKNRQQLLLTWFEKNNHIPACQSGFRRSKSTHDHFLRFYNSIIHGFNNNMKSVAIFFDLEKAFDKINHKAILLKLKSLKLNASLYNWISNFFNNRLFFVQCKDSRSNAFDIN